jgi:peptidoglycan/LPS O-acetylase OafA/YrhL
MLTLSINFFLVGICSRLALDGALLKKKWFVIFYATVAFVLLTARPVELCIWGVWCVFMCIECGLWPANSVFRRAFGYGMNVIAVNPGVSALGKWSYSAYLIHIPLFSCVVYFLAKKMGLGYDSWHLQVYMLTSMAILPAVSWLMYKYIEQPGIRLGARVVSAINARKPTA